MDKQQTVNKIADFCNELESLQAEQQRHRQALGEINGKLRETEKAIWKLVGVYNDSLNEQNDEVYQDEYIPDEFISGNWLIGIDWDDDVEVTYRKVADLNTWPRS